MNNSLLIEIGTEEMPPLHIESMGKHFLKLILSALSENQISYGVTQLSLTPRRFGVLIHEVPTEQPTQQLSIKGPKYDVCFTETGELTPPAEGFLKKVKANISQCTKKETNKGTFLFYENEEPGKPLSALLPGLLLKVVPKVNSPKKMFWGENKGPFIRPLHWLVAMHGQELIPCELFGVASNNITYGHSTHHPAPITLNSSDEYFSQLQLAEVMPIWEKRREHIKVSVEEQGRSLEGEAVIDENNLNEVTGLTEWPVIYHGNYNPEFLTLPLECLVSTMESHQRYFPVIGRDGKLLPYFIFASNIHSKHPPSVIAGNERVLSARLHDAKFFYDQDLKTPLASHYDSLENVVFQQKLGTMLDKSKRIQSLSRLLAEHLQVDNDLCLKAAKLAKCDLLTHMVYEFPELQGIMGRYYATQQNESARVARAIEEHYWPKFSGDNIPSNAIAQVIALADKLDTLAGIFAINLIPTGTKDPYALRRAALGVVRIATEGQLSLPLDLFLNHALSLQPTDRGNDSMPTLRAFIQERAKHYFIEQDFDPGHVDSVLSLGIDDYFDAHLRLLSLQSFIKEHDVTELVQSCKRVHNILKKVSLAELPPLDPAVFQASDEQQLYDKIIEIEQQATESLNRKDYTALLQLLCTLQSPVEKFFENVMVNCDDQPTRLNRMGLLSRLKQQYCIVADMAGF